MKMKIAPPKKVQTMRANPPKKKVFDSSSYEEVSKKAKPNKTVTSKKAQIIDLDVEEIQCEAHWRSGLGKINIARHE